MRSTSGSAALARFLVLTVLALAAAAPPAHGAFESSRAGDGVLGDVLARYARAIRDAGTPEPAAMTTDGLVNGLGLQGAFHTWRQGDRERSDVSLGPRSETTLRIGSRIWYGNSDGAVREFTGILARRTRTERFIESGEFASAPERCAYRGRVTLAGGRRAYAVDVTAPAGETQTVYLDAATGLPDRVAFDDDDGRTTVDFADWRSVGGRRYPFQTVVSDGDRAFDTQQTTTSIDVAPTVDPRVFAPLVPRYIDMAASDSVPLEWQEGHVVVPVRIGTRTYKFLLDSGSQNVVLDARVVAQLGLDAVGALEASGAARTGGLRLVPLRELEIGRGRLRDIVATTLDLQASTGGAFRIDGILGAPFFAAASVRLDFARGIMTFGPPRSLAALGRRLPLVLDRGLAEATLRLNGTTDAPFIIDTGSPSEVLLYKPFVDKHGGVVPYSTNRRVSYGIGGATESYRSTLDALELADIAIYHADADVMRATSGAFADRIDAGNVGLGVLKNFVVTFDEAEAALYLEKGRDFDDGRMRV